MVKLHYFFLIFLPLSLHALTLPELEARARARNPELRVARQAWEELAAQQGPAGTLPNPTFSFIKERFPSDTPGAPPETIRHYRFEQPVPFPGKLSQEAQMKRHETLIAETDYRAKELDIIGQVREQAYQLYLTDQSSRLAEDSVAVLKSALRTSQAHLASGQASAADVFLAQTELRRMENLAFTQSQARILAQIQINALLDDPTDQPVALITPLPLEELGMTLTAVQDLARRQSPLIRYGHHENDHSRTMLARSRLDYAPDFNLIAERESADHGQPGSQLGIAVTFPLWLTRPWGSVRAARAHVLATEAMAEDRAALVRRMVHMEFTEQQTHLTTAKMYRDGIIPAAESALNVVRQQYASGQVDFLHFLEAFRAWLTARLDYETEIYHYAEHRTALERWVGVDFTEKPS